MSQIMCNLSVNNQMKKMLIRLTQARGETRLEDDGSQVEQKTPRLHLFSFSWTRFIHLWSQTGGGRTVEFWF